MLVVRGDEPSGTIIRVCFAYRTDAEVDDMGATIIDVRIRPQIVLAEQRLNVARAA